MPTVASARGTKLLIQIGDGGGPETFAHDCLINAERGVVFAVDTNEFVIPDCDSPDDPAWKEITKDGISASVTGAGVLHTTTAKTAWYDWLVDADPKTCRINLNVASGVGGGYWSGEFHCTQFEITGDRNGKLTANVTIVSTGALTWTDAS